jgi:hypothetical protein
MTSRPAAGELELNAAVSELSQFERLLAPEQDSNPLPDAIEGEFQRLQPVESRLLRAVLTLLPWLLLLACFIRIALFEVHPGVVMYLSSLVAVAAALLGFQVLMGKIRDVPRALWQRGVIGQRTRDGQSAAGYSLADDYAHFVNGFGRALNHHGQFALGATLGMAGAAWVVYDTLRGIEFSAARMAWELALAFSLGFFLGLLAWRMVVTGYEVAKLGRQFELRMQLGHPDRCGGLSPLGILCFWNAMIISVAGIHLGAWLIIAPNLAEPYQDLAATYHDLYIALLVVPLVFAVVGFFLPLRAAHQEMLAERERLERRLAQISNRIDQLSRQMLDKADELEPEVLEAMGKQLKSMRETYMENQHPPVWPFDTRLLMKFVSTQTVPILALTGLGAPLLDAISSLLSFADKPA